MFFHHFPLVKGWTHIHFSGDNHHFPQENRHFPGKLSIFTGKSAIFHGKMAMFQGKLAEIRHGARSTALEDLGANQLRWLQGPSQWTGRAGGVLLDGWTVVIYNSKLIVITRWYQSSSSSSSLTITKQHSSSGWLFGTFFIFPYIWNNLPN